MIFDIISHVRLSKYLYIIVTAFAFISIVHSNPAREFFRGVHVGMGLKELELLLPSGQLKKVYTNQWAFEDEIYDLKGKWVYNFKDGKLEWFSYSAYFVEPGDLNKHNFNKCLSAVKKLINDYTKIYGAPVELKKGKQEFIDPYKKHHWGYEVISARWIDNNETIKVSFNFQGSKGIYYFVVDIQH